MKTVNTPKVKFCCIRRCEAQQWENWHGDLVGRHIKLFSFCEEFSDLPDSFHHYSWYELVTTGWSTGTRTRVKKLSADRLLAYINKLYAGSWISDEAYDVMYSASNALLLKHREGPWAGFSPDTISNIYWNLYEENGDVHDFIPSKNQGE